MHPSPDDNLGSAAIAFASSFVPQRWPGARLMGQTKLRGDASTRAYLRLELAPGSSKAPQSLIAMILSDSATTLSSDELGVFGDGGPEELPFVNVARYLASKTDALPRIEGNNEDHTLLLLEDVGDTTLWDAAAASANPENEFCSALDWLLAMQKVCTDDKSGCYAFRQSFDERVFSWEFKHFLEFGISKDAPAALLAEAEKELDAKAAWLGGLPQVFCHRDFHAWNLHRCDGRLRVIDFQDALLGPALYDVASLLTDRATPTLVTPKMEESLVNYFLERVSLDDGWEQYRACALQRTLKVVGRFNFLADVKGKPAYRPMLADVVPTARRQLGSCEGLTATTELFDGWVRNAPGEVA